MTSFSLLETMRLEHGHVPRLDRHIARMEASARHFGFPWRPESVREAVAAAARTHPEGTWRLRLLLDKDGAASVECAALEQASSHVPWRVAFAAEPVDHHDPFILNKTTHRKVYDHARRSMPDVNDVLLWNRKGEVTESTIGNVVAEIGGVRYTPPVGCGLLAGTFRAEQVEAGEIHERVLWKADIATATRLWIINSVREWVEVELVIGDL
jgi:para-aminobenzoate synthetase/4-amino-4-deoxychorismate lyase